MEKADNIICTRGIHLEMPLFAVIFSRASRHNQIALDQYRCQDSPFMKLPKEVLYKLCEYVAGNLVRRFDGAQAHFFEPPFRRWQTAKVSLTIGDAQRFPECEHGLYFVVAGVKVRLHADCFILPRSGLMSLEYGLQHPQHTYPNPYYYIHDITPLKTFICIQLVVHACGSVMITAQDDKGNELIPPAKQNVQGYHISDLGFTYVPTIYPGFHSQLSGDAKFGIGTVAFY